MQSCWDFKCEIMALKKKKNFTWSNSGENIRLRLNKLINERLLLLLLFYGEFNFKKWNIKYILYIYKSPQTQSHPMNVWNIAELNSFLVNWGVERDNLQPQLGFLSCSEVKDWKRELPLENWFNLTATPIAHALKCLKQTVSAWRDL